MKEHHQRGALGVGKPVEVDEVAVGGVPALALQARQGALAEQRPDGLGVAARQPGRCTVAVDGGGHQCTMCGLSLPRRLSRSGAGEA